MEKVYRLGDITENSNIERTTVLIKKEDDLRKIISYYEENGVFSKPKECFYLELNKSSIEFFKAIKNNFINNGVLNIYIEKNKGVFRTDFNECIKTDKLIYLINRNKNFGVIFNDKQDLIDLFFNLEEIEKSLKNNSVIMTKGIK